jgi:hypothetical protein
VADDPWDRTEHFGWEDSFAEMRVLVPIAPHVTSRHICVNISSTRLVVSLCSGRGAVADWDAGAAGEGAGEERAGAGAGAGHGGGCDPVCLRGRGGTFSNVHSIVIFHNKYTYMADF